MAEGTTWPLRALSLLFDCPFFVFLILCQSVMSHIMNSVQHQKTNNMRPLSDDRIEEEEKNTTVVKKA